MLFQKKSWEKWSHFTCFGWKETAQRAQLHLKVNWKHQKGVLWLGGHGCDKAPSGNTHNVIWKTQKNLINWKIILLFSDQITHKHKYGSTALRHTSALSWQFRECNWIMLEKGGGGEMRECALQRIDLFSNYTECEGRAKSKFSLLSQPWLEF